MNWHTLLTAKLMSGRVIVAYCSALTTNLYRIGSLKGSIPDFDKLLVATKGVGKGCAS